MAERIGGPGPAQLKAFRARLAAAAPQVRTDLRRELRSIATPVASRVKAEIEGSTGWHAQPAGATRTRGKKGRRYTSPAHPHSPLRKEISGTISVSVGASRAGVRMDIVSSGRKMPPGKETLPIHSDRRRGWGHPVFLHGSVAALPRSKWAWVREWGPVGWFERSAYDAGRDAQKAGKVVIDEVRARLEI